jgi:RNA polymerase sigma-70 factor (ECF subfamily)
LAPSPQLRRFHAAIGAAAARALCAWEREWLTTGAAGEATRRDAATAVIQQAPSWPLIVRTAGGGTLNTLAEPGRRGRTRRRRPDTARREHELRSSTVGGHAMTPEQRFTRLVESAGGRVLAYLTRRVDPACDAADLLSDTLAVAWRRIGDLPADDEQATAWLIGVARGVLANHRRGADAARGPGRPAARSPGRADRPGRPGRRGGAMRDALARLSEPDQQLLTMTAWDGLTTEEVATALKISPAAGRQRLARARRRLRELIFDRRAPTSAWSGAASIDR